MAGELIPLETVYSTGMPYCDRKQKFSFRSCDEGLKMSIFPSSFECAMTNFNSDTSFVNTIDGDPKSRFQEIVDALPRVRVREYLLVPVINNIVSSFQSFLEGFEEGMKAAEKSSLKELGDKLLKGIKNVIENPAILEEIFKPVIAKFENYGLITATTTVDKMFNHIPFIMYYGIVQTKTMHRYTLPYTDKIIDKANGMPGWGGILDSMFGIFKPIQSMININSATMPVWRGGGDDGDSQQFQIQFDLFNTNPTAAASNFLFVNTIVPMNKYLQYHFFQNGPAVYDLQIDGVGRFFMCAAQIDVQYKGVMRSPSKKFRDIVQNYMNVNYWSQYKANEFSKFDSPMNTFRKILDARIPDVYSVKITFKSLLPNNFNNHILRYSLNDIEKNNQNFENDKNIVELITTGFQKAFQKAIGGGGEQSQAQEEAPIYNPSERDMEEPLPGEESTQPNTPPTQEQNDSTYDPGARDEGI